MYFGIYIYFLAKYVSAIIIEFYIKSPSKIFSKRTYKLIESFSTFDPVKSFQTPLFRWVFACDTFFILFIFEYDLNV